MLADRVHGPLWTVEQYLEMERRSPIRHELIDGYVYAMAGMQWPAARSVMIGSHVPSRGCWTITWRVVRARSSP
jgi:hypothetical protein